MAVFWEFLSCICMFGLVFVSILSFLGYFSCIVTDSAPRWLRRFSFPGRGWFRIASRVDFDLELQLQPIRNNLADNSIKITDLEREIASLHSDMRELIRHQGVVTNSTLPKLATILEKHDQYLARAIRSSDNPQDPLMATSGSSKGDALAS